MHQPPNRGKWRYSCVGRGGYSRNYPSDAFVQRPPQLSYFSGYQPLTDATDYQKIIILMKITNIHKLTIPVMTEESITNKNVD